LVIVLLALCVQISDLSGLRLAVRTQNSGNYVSPLHAADWQGLGQAHKHLVVLPAWQCGGGTLPRAGELYNIFGRFAVEQHLTLNSYYAARYSSAQIQFHCHTLHDEVAAGILDPYTAYVVDNRLLLALSKTGQTSHYCRKVDDYTLCTHEPNRHGVDPQLLSQLTSR
jgi:hypothetical protein